MLLSNVLFAFFASFTLIACDLPHSASTLNVSTTKVITPMSSKDFVTRTGSQLMLNGQPFRFAGANMHWLGMDDSTQYVSQFRVNDGLDAAKEMGATVVRAHNLGISTGCSNCIEPQLGQFNEDAFAHHDYAIKAAHDHSIRLIIPLTDNWHYPAGGKHNFTNWRGITNENEFYTNTQVINDFKDYIQKFLNHVNTYTGRAYKDDPTILAWETGNELKPSTIWTQTISTYIKSIDHNHLIVDGKTGVDPQAVNLTNIDMVSNHYYPMNIAKLKKDADDAQRAEKVFYVGEFSWNDHSAGDKLKDFLSTIETISIIAGDSYWQLWSHDDGSGYISDDADYTLHYPGDSPTMRAHVQLLRTHAYKMSMAPMPKDSTPGTPLITGGRRRSSSFALRWEGVAVAASYTIERSTSGPDGPWKVVCNNCATDVQTPWVDKTIPRGPVWYRVTAYNLSGVAGTPSSPYRAQ